MRPCVILVICVSLLNWQSAIAQDASAAPTSGPGPTAQAGPGLLGGQSHPVVMDQVEAAPWPGAAARPPQFWAEADYLLWWIKPIKLGVPTLTAGSTADPIPGAIGQPHTQVLLGNKSFEFGALSGVRASAGFAINDDRSAGFELGGFVLEHAVARQSFVSNASTTTTYIPFQDPNSLPRARPFTVPNQIQGSSFIKAQSRLWGAEANAFCGCSSLWGETTYRAQLIGGIRYLDLADELVLRNYLQQTANPSISAAGQDNFGARNQFYGGQIGVRAQAQWYAWTVEVAARLALGATHQVSTVSGVPILTTTGGGGNLLPGPLLVLNSNSGRQSDDVFTLIPDLSAKIRLDCTENVAVTFGYNFLYWARVLSPGDQVDPRVNTTQLPNQGPFVGPALPAPQFVRSNFFAQGFSFGLELKY